MMKLRKMMTLGLIILSGGLFAQAQGIQLPHVSVTGMATEKVTPDEMNWQLSIETKGAELKAVAEEHSKTTAAVLDILKSFKVDKEQTQTTGMSFGEEWRYRSGSRIKEGYKASTNISFKLKDFSQYNELWSKLSSVKNVSVNDVSYSYSKRKELQSRMRVKALLNAKAKAVEMAEALGSKIGEPLLIVDGNQNQGAYRSRSLMKVADDGFGFGNSKPQNPIAKGQIEIGMAVSVSFRLLTP